MTDRTSNDNPVVARAYQLAAKQAADLINGTYLSPGEIVELYVGVGVGVALKFSPASDIADHLRTLADDIDRGDDLH